MACLVRLFAPRAPGEALWLRQGCSGSSATVFHTLTALGLPTHARDYAGRFVALAAEDFTRKNHPPEARGKILKRWASSGIMFNISLLENLRVQISSRPPLVVFMVSVSATAIAFLTLGYFFKIKEIKSPERTEDWNTFLLRFNDLDFCISENETLKHLMNDTTTPESAMTSSQVRPSMPSPQTLEDSGPVNTSVAITLTLDPLKPFAGFSRNITHLSSSIFGHQIGLSGRDAHEEINITFALPTAWNADDCVLHGHCSQVVFTACMTVTAAATVFPVTVQPPHCTPETYVNATFWYKVFTTARDSDTKYAQDYNPLWCYKGAIGKVYHALNPKLTLIVPDDDRSLINLHLMHTSYFLFVMVITMFCYAVIKGRPSKLRQSSPELCPEKVAFSEA